MALVNCTDVQLLDNLGHICDPFKFDITFQCLGKLSEGILFSRPFFSPPHCLTVVQTWSGALRMWGLRTRTSTIRFWSL